MGVEADVNYAEATPGGVRGNVDRTLGSFSNRLRQNQFGM